MSLTERLVQRTAAWLEDGPLRSADSRRGFLAKLTVGGAALATQPWRYLTRPESAYAVCAGGGTDNSCGAGYTVFCCTINQGHNICPPGTFTGGWWKADRSSYCGGAARYYIDCNAAPGSSWTCRCNDTNCDHRFVACNVFRYGQCNTHIAGVTPVVCRQISCVPPWKLYPGECGAASATDNNTAGHHAPCLTPTGAPRLPKAPSALQPGERLAPRGRLTSPNRLVSLVMEPTGRLVLRSNRNDLLWRSPSAGPGAFVELQHNGALVLCRLHRAAAVWNSGTAGIGACVLQVHDSGNLVLVHAGTGGVRWQTHTRLSQ